MTPITLHSFIRFDRGARVRWTALELGLPIVEQKLDFRDGEHKREPYLTLNPNAVVPAIEFDGQTMFDSTAICLHLCEQHPEAGLMPRHGEPGRTEALSWLMHMATSVDRVCFDAFSAKVLAPDPVAHAAAIERAQPVVAKIDRHLLNREYLALERFTLADILAGYDLGTLKRGGLPLEEYPAVAAYYQRVTARPAAQASGFFSGYGL
ncbi:hypothetical protein C7S18_00750 [Ahniella affigens]|uniref:Glutathione S-transferase n=1 Tax=Ahniella affigens TaxID=2021234 RepID=A0A2P1PLU8_9GAMM|nr:glutathione S-transferase family protein [Ahniella affigens]AVP95816.1 hypothetical protein C7S18_00750 [Ahniella affigens]